MIIDGTKIAEDILKQLRKLPVPEREFAAVLVGDDPASLSFLRQKERAAESLGIKFKLYQLSEDLAQSQLVAKIVAISADPKVGGMIVQLPLPRKFDRVAVLNAIGIEKDVDVLNGETTKVLAPAAGALEKVLSALKFDLAGKHAVVVGSGLLIGRPIINWLMSQTRQLTVVNQGGYDPQVIRTADLVVAGTGVPRLIRGEHLKQGAVVIDYGYGRDEEDQLTGDVDFKSAQRTAGFITPTPGGMGPIVVAQLFVNFYRLS
jgi:methylenetetrahydrofolate dehydrogenase (NADP+) / methenyltetrahydrofolate cyclohydrolase